MVRFKHFVWAGYITLLYSSFYFPFAVDKTEALHKQSSLQVASGTSSVSSSIAAAASSASKVSSPALVPFYSSLIELLSLNMPSTKASPSSASLVLITIITFTLMSSFISSSWLITNNLDRQNVDIFYLLS